MRGGSETLWECQPSSDSVGALRGRGPTALQPSPSSSHERFRRGSPESRALPDMSPDGDRPPSPDHENYWNGNSTEFEG
jgi:hypothetical protein